MTTKDWKLKQNAKTVMRWYNANGKVLSLISAKFLAYPYNGKKIWQLELWDNKTTNHGILNMVDYDVLAKQEFKTKKQALTLAKAYMRKH